MSFAMSMHVTSSSRAASLRSFRAERSHKRTDLSFPPVMASGLVGCVDNPQSSSKWPYSGNKMRKVQENDIREIGFLENNKKIQRNDEKIREKRELLMNMCYEDKKLVVRCFYFSSRLHCCLFFKPNW